MAPSCAATLLLSHPRLIFSPSALVFSRSDRARKRKKQKTGSVLRRRRGKRRCEEGKGQRRPAGLEGPVRPQILSSTLTSKHPLGTNVLPRPRFLPPRLGVIQDQWEVRVLMTSCCRPITFIPLNVISFILLPPPPSLLQQTPHRPPDTMATSAVQGSPPRSSFPPRCRHRSPHHHVRLRYHRHPSIPSSR